MDHRNAHRSILNSSKPDNADYLQQKEDVMDKVWLYLGGIILGAVVLIYGVISFVSTANPPASDLRAAYEQEK